MLFHTGVLYRVRNTIDLGVYITDVFYYENGKYRTLFELYRN